MIHSKKKFHEERCHIQIAVIFFHVFSFKSEFLSDIICILSLRCILQQLKLYMFIWSYLIIQKKKKTACVILSCLLGFIGFMKIQQRMDMHVPWNHFINRSLFILFKIFDKSWLFGLVLWEYPVLYLNDIMSTVCTLYDFSLWHFCFRSSFFLFSIITLVFYLHEEMQEFFAWCFYFFPIIFYPSWLHTVN